MEQKADFNLDNAIGSYVPKLGALSDWNKNLRFQMGISQGIYRLNTCLNNSNFISKQILSNLIYNAKVESWIEYLYEVLCQK